MKLLIATLLLFPALALAQPVNLNGSSAGKNGHAIGGYDVVAYFADAENAPVKGDTAYSSQWNGAVWLFASAENRARFAADPERYAPQYGGYCAYAVSKGYTAPVEPDQFTVYQDKLYLNYNAAVNRTWRADKDGYIKAAGRNWPGLLKSFSQ